MSLPVVQIGFVGRGRVAEVAELGHQRLNDNLEAVLAELRTQRRPPPTSHNITADVEVIAIQNVNEAYERLLKSDVKYRFSIDMASLKAS